MGQMVWHSHDIALEQTAEKCHMKSWTLKPNKITMTMLYSKEKSIFYLVWKIKWFFLFDHIKGSSR